MITTVCLRLEAINDSGPAVSIVTHYVHSTSLVNQKRFANTGVTANQNADCLQRVVNLIFRIAPVYALRKCNGLCSESQKPFDEAPTW